jgi:glyoxylase-like metal-dependent hydrolase (beta-lactamase superfamily II)
METSSALVQDWFEVRENEPGVFAIAEPLHFERVRSHLVVGSERAALLDTGMGVGDIRAVAESLTDRPIFVLNTHSHWDHIGGNWRFDEIMIHEAEADALNEEFPRSRLNEFFQPEYLFGPLPLGIGPELIRIPASHATTLLDDGDIVDLGGRNLEIFHAPGHSAGGIVLLDSSSGAFFSTDVAYAGPLYCYSGGTDFDDYLATFERIATLLPRIQTVYPSHNESPMAASLLVDMRDGFREIRDGRTPDSIESEIGTHAFDGFAIRVAVNPDGSVRR